MVGDGTPASCTEAAFDVAWTQLYNDLGGTLTFQCGAAPHTIGFYVVKSVDNIQITVDGGGLITLQGLTIQPGGSGTRLFQIAEGGFLTLQNIVLTGGRSPTGTGWGSQGGAIVLWDDADDTDAYEIASLTMISSTIRDSASTAWGGAIANEGGVVHLENSGLYNNVAPYGGAFNGTGYETFINVTAAGNTAQQAGGALRFWHSPQVRISESTIADNLANTLDGGGLDIQSAHVRIDRSYIEHNTAARHGGGIQNQGVLTITNSRIALNTASQFYGGGINSNGVISLTQTTLQGNSAAQGGGAIFNGGGQLYLTKATVLENSATLGGGIYANGGGVIIEQSTIADNQATTGGGFYLTEIIGANANNWVKIGASDITGNRANQGGGGIAANRAYVTIHDTEIANNTSTAIHLSQTASGGSYLAVTQSSIHDNTGGGLYNGEASTLLIGNSTISQNGGWGLWSGQNSIHTALNFSTVRGNSAGQIKRTGGPLVLASTAIDGGGVAALNCATETGLPALESTHSWSSDSSCGQAVMVSSNFNLAALAMNGGTTPSHLPQIGSVLINAGGNCGSTTKNDQRGQLRPVGGACDVGAIETNPQTPIKLPQTISVTTPVSATVSQSPFVINANVSSGLTIIFSSQTPAVCTVTGNVVRLVMTGNCTLVASQPGDSTYEPAADVTMSFVVVVNPSGSMMRGAYLPLVAR